MSENKVYTAIGMMSGTSLDGIDIALISTDGKDDTKLLDFKTFAYERDEKSAIKLVFGATKPSKDVEIAANFVTKAHIRAVEAFGHKADIIGFHGQTIHHDPGKRFTWQIGSPQYLADQTAIPVVGDMRQADILAGGQGAPLLPLCHRSFAAQQDRPIAILNLGGVGNITWLGTERSDILAFDTGPANALIDDLVQLKTGEPYDSQGRLALAGTPDQNLITQWLLHPFFNKQPPKSLDRNQWDVREVYNLKLEDAVATLSQFTVQSVLRSLKHLPDLPKALYVAGGGRHNTAMMMWLQQALPYPIEPVEKIGWNGDALEAQGFGYLAVRSLLGLALTLPTTTGAPKPMTGGKIYYPFQISPTVFEGCKTVF